MLEANTCRTHKRNTGPPLVMIFVGLKSCLAREGIKFNADGVFEIGFPFIPYIHTSATFMHEKEDFHFGVRLNISSFRPPGLRALCGFYGSQSNFSPGFAPSCSTNFNFVWSQDRQLSAKSTTLIAGLSILPGLKLFGSCPLQDAMDAQVTNWSVGGMIGLIPFTSLVVAMNQRRQIGFGGRIQVHDSGLGITASLLVDGTNPADWKYDPNKLAVGLEFG